MSSFLKKKKALFPVAAVFIWTAAIITFFLSYVNLTPEVNRNFFFSSDDPQFQQDKQIRQIFEEPQQVIIGVKGDIRSPAYIEKIRALSEELDGMDIALGAQSMTHGPASIENAFQSPLWKRIIISDDLKSTNIILFVEDIAPDRIVAKVENILRQYHGPDFELMMTGPPYILAKIQSNLMRDLKVFSLAAFVIFGVILFIIFRAVLVLVGTLIACLNASALTLIVTSLLGIEIGVLTANLSTIVFVLTLSHCIFITFNWQRIAGEKPDDEKHTADAVKVTVSASFWSMLTTLLGFSSLIFVQATPLQKLGVSGALGTFVAFVVAYLIYPWFLKATKPRARKGGFMKIAEKAARGLFKEKHFLLVLAVFTVVISAAVGIFRLNTDPNLLTYFEEGSELRSGLEYMDRNGGSSPLKIVLEDSAGRKFSTEEVYRQLWSLQRTLEKHDSVGNIISLPLVMAEGRDRIPLSFFLPWEWLIEILEQPIAHEIASYFVTPDRKRALFVLRMKESGRTYSRQSIVEQIKGIIWSKKFVPALMGGVFLLQGKLAQLVTASLFWGLLLLIGLFVIMGFLLSRSPRVTGAMFLSLCIIPGWLLGLLGHLRVPLDIISAPATNIAIAMGVDAMIHTLIFVKRAQDQGMEVWDSWVDSRARLWKPIMSSMIIICAGFGIFSMSRFPPTQRFGYAVILGTVMSPIAALLVLPNLAVKKKKGKQRRE